MAGPDTAGTRPLTTRRAPRIGRSFSSRNPLPIGIIGLVFIVVLLIAAFNASSLPLIGGGTEYTAYFSESANLKSGDDVRIAGVTAGKVSDVTLHGPRVKVVFDVKNGWVGDTSTVDIKLKTLLGAKFLSVNSQGQRAQDSSRAIPMSRTSSPFDVYPAFTKLTRTIQGIDTAGLTKAFETLAQTFSGTPASVRPVVTGLSRLSTTIASRDAELHDLLGRANQVTGVLAARDQDLTQLLRDGNLLLAELNARRDAIHALLVNTVALAGQLRGLVADNQRTLDPLLGNVETLIGTLERNRDSLDRGLALLGPFYRVFNNVVGNGRWFDNYIENLGPTGVLGAIGILPTATVAAVTGSK